MLKLLWLTLNVYGLLFLLLEWIPRPGATLQGDLLALAQLALASLLLALARRRYAPSYSSLVFGSLGLAMLAVATLSCHGCCRMQGRLTACKSNLKNLATGLEMWASDHAGRYPAALDLLLVGNYLKSLPTCPAAGRNTYSPTYRRKGKGFELSCGGCHHHDAGLDQPDYPRWDSDQGLLVP